MTPLPTNFFDQLPAALCQALLGKILCVRHADTGLWLYANIIETEAYYLTEPGSHSSLGRTPSREAMFMLPGTIYMYYARGHASMNISAQGDGNAILIKSAYPYTDNHPDPERMITQMQFNNPQANGQPRPINKLCTGQTLLCRSLNLTVEDWNSQAFDPERCFIADTGITPSKIIQTTRLGIPPGRGEDLMHRYIDAGHAKHCTSNPFAKKHPPPLKVLTPQWSRT